MSIKEKANTTIEINGQTFNFKNITVEDYPSRLYVPMAGVSQVIRQYIKQRWPDRKIQISSDTFAGGDSVTVYAPFVSREESRKMQQELSGLFTYGRFNGMYDIYEMKEGYEEFTIEHRGKRGEVSTKYLNVENRAKWGTKLYKELEAQEA